MARTRSLAPRSHARTAQRPLRRARLAGLALVVLTGATACGGDGPVGGGGGSATVATVDGHDISFDDVRDLLQAQERFYAERKEEGVPEEAAQLDELLAGVRGTGRDTLGAAGFSSALQELITYQAVVDELEENDVEITDADRDATRAQLAEQVGGEQELARLDREYVAATVRTQTALAKLQELVDAEPAADGPTEDELRELYEQTKDSQPICLNVILAADEAGAAAAKARVEGGEAFADVAAEVSQDPGSAAQGGFVGCGTPEVAAQTFPGDYTDVAVGDLVGPTPTTGGVVLVEIESTTGPTFEQIRPTLEEQLAAEGPEDAAIDVRLAEIVREADVTVDRRYGTWDPGEAASETTAGREGGLTPPVDPGADRPTSDVVLEPSAP
ncbi:MAG TPA: peptidyl-prolyl cis-trans isomerase [Aquihabitans sp.]|nr:peptidyl-prolyl cis-trans isomerase [Aquihabitans sp.]